MGLSKQLRHYNRRLACIDVRKGSPIPGDAQPLPSTAVPNRSSERLPQSNEQQDGQLGTLSSNAPQTSYITLRKLDLLLQQWKQRILFLAQMVNTCR